MVKQTIYLGTTANDGTGDTLRQAGAKINTNFSELYALFGGDSLNLLTSIALYDSGVRYTSPYGSNYSVALGFQIGRAHV